MTAPLSSGAIIGVLGSGQLGRMMAQAAQRLGYRVHVYSPDAKSPTGQIAEKEWVGAYDDHDRLKQFFAAINLLTIEFENIPVDVLQLASRFIPVHPAADALLVTQHRLREKTFLRDAGFPVTDFRSVNAAADLADALREFRSVIIKTASSGYDGKGQLSMEFSASSPQEQATTAWQRLGNVECIVEKRVPFRCELSVIAARGRDGTLAAYGPFINHHRRHILDLTYSPASRLSTATQCAAQEIARGIVAQLNYVGVMGVEMFLTHDGKVLVNELAPRPHNSGHLTIDAHETSQFEQHVRAIAGLPLGGVKQRSGGAAMVNLLGDLWQNGEPQWSRLAALPNVALHMYGKSEARPGRKMGHLTVVAQNALEAVVTARRARAALVHPY